MPARVRALGDELVVDDRLAYGPRIVAARGRARASTARRFERVRAAQAAAGAASGGAD